jgi:hypothetical protein
MAKKGELKSNATEDSKRQREYNSSPEQKKRRAERNRVRRRALADGKVKKGDGKDIDHKDKNTANDSESNLRVRSVSANRADNRGTGGRKRKRRG